MYFLHVEYNSKNIIVYVVSKPDNITIKVLKCPITSTKLNSIHYFNEKFKKDFLQYVNISNTIVLKNDPFSIDILLSMFEGLNLYAIVKFYNNKYFINATPYKIDRIVYSENTISVSDLVKHLKYLRNNSIFQ